MLAPCFVEKTALAESRLRRLFEYWEQKRGLRKAPLRAEINPAEIPDLLGFINLYEVLTKPRDYLVRLNGSEVAAALRRDATGMVLSKVMTGDAGTRCQEAFAMCVDHWTPAFVETTMSFCGRDYIVQRILALPLSRDGRNADMIVSAHAFRPVDRIEYELPGAVKASK